VASPSLFIAEKAGLTNSPISVFSSVGKILGTSDVLSKLLISSTKDSNLI